MEKKMETTIVNWGGSQIMGTILGGPNTTDYNILGSYWDPLILGNYVVAFF